MKNLKTNDPLLFMGYFPELEYPFWSFNDENKDVSGGYIYCKLAEPCKPEWIKKD